MDELTQLLLSEVRGIMQGKNAPERVAIGQCVMLKGGRIYLASGMDKRTLIVPVKDGDDVISADDLRKALATLKQTHVEHTERRIAKLQKRAELDKRLLALLREYDNEG